MNKPKVNKNTLSKFYSDAKPLFLASAFTQIVSFTANLYLAKIYGEEYYGFWGTFLSFTAILAIFFTLQLEHNIVTKITQQKFWFNTCFYSSLFITVLTLLISFLIHIYNPTPNYHLIYLIILGGGLTSLLTINESFLTAKSNFKTIAIIKICISLITITTQLILFKTSPETGLITGSIIGLSIGIALILNINKKHITKTNTSSILKKIKSKENTLTKYLLPSNILNSIGTNGMPILILFCFDAKLSGIFFLSMKILGAPLQLLSNSISKVYFQKASKYYNYNKTEELLSLTIKIIKKNTLIVLACLISINSIGIYVLELFFAKNWENLNLFTLILSFLILCRSMFNPISSIIVITNTNHISLLFNIYLITCNIIAISVGYYFNNIITTIIISSFICGLGYLYLLKYYYHFLKKKNLCLPN